MVQRSRIEDQPPQEMGGRASAQPLQDAVGVFRTGQDDSERLEWQRHTCAVYRKQIGHAGGQGAAGTAVAGVEVRRFTAGRTPLDRFIREGARLAQEGSLGRLTDQNARSAARSARCGGRQSCSVAGVAHRPSRPEDLDLRHLAAQGTCARFARAACVAVERTQATVDVVAWADPFTDDANLLVSLVAPVAGVRPGAVGSGDDGNDLSADTAQAGRAGVAVAADRPVGGQCVDPA